MWQGSLEHVAMHTGKVLFGVDHALTGSEPEPWSACGGCWQGRGADSLQFHNTLMVELTDTVLNACLVLPGAAL